MVEIALVGAALLYMVGAGAYGLINRRTYKRFQYNLKLGRELTGDGTY